MDDKKLETQKLLSSLSETNLPSVAVSFLLADRPSKDTVVVRSRFDSKTKCLKFDESPNISVEINQIVSYSFHVKSEFFRFVDLRFDTALKK